MESALAGISDAESDNDAIDVTSGDGGIPHDDSDVIVASDGSQDDYRLLD